VKRAAEIRFLEARLVEEAAASMCVEACTRPSPGLKALLEKARDRSPDGPGREALNLCVLNLEAALETGLPVCQDTGVAVFFAEKGNMLVIPDGTLDDAIHRGVARGYREGFLRNSLVGCPLERNPLEANSPAVIHTREVEGRALRLRLLVKGAGSENVSAASMLPPLAGEKAVAAFVRDAVLEKGAGACPPLFVGVGLGGDMEMCSTLAKEALLRPFGRPSEAPELRRLEEAILLEVNASGTGPQGFGGPVTALEVRVESRPCHMASLPVAVCLDCHAHRTAEIIL
jgi:fumarate hydratase subunit alpha